MEDPTPQDKHSLDLFRQHERLPPSPPETDDNASIQSDSVIDGPDIPLPPLSRYPSVVLDIDKNTPDFHVPRDPRLIRLTGTHPLNVEPPLTTLLNEGFLTTPELFYVRNHGAVPRVQEEDIPNWEFSISGLVEHPMTVTLRELISDYDQITQPVTLVCAGNRRKEQNVVRKSKGFSWGSAGVSTALFTGAWMADVIRKASPLKRARYVCMEGADELPNGYYATSLKLNWVMDPNRGIMLAHKMNGEMLRPDHGKPLRAVVPGQIGGRSVKWLKKLIITEKPSENWYHIYDNRVLPTMVSPEESAKDPKWWVDERYAIYELSPNSAIAYPQHDEQLSINDSEKYRARGYAYSGGGRRVTRVEITLDKGKSWRLADIDYPEDQYRNSERELFGGQLDMTSKETCFCWCFWTLDIPVADMAVAQDIFVRAMDEAMNMQPRDMYWNVMGMMNNPWFRVTILREGDTLKFEHPIQAGLIPGGWMQRIKNAGGDLTNGFWGEKIGGESEKIVKPDVKDIQMKKDGVDRVITIDELRKHDSDSQPWFVVNGEVYDGTAFLKEHPGGAISIVNAAGLDSTDEFMAIHSETAKAMMPDYHIGSLDEASKIVLSEGGAPKDESEEPRSTFLQTRSWSKASLVLKRIVSWDTRIFTFKLEHEEQILGLPVGQHLMIRLKDLATGEAIIRSYTPISSTTKKGYLDVLVKIYFDTDTTKGGKMTKAMEALPLGADVEFKGPIGKFEYLGKGLCAINGIRKTVKRFLMICGGSGVTPIFQVFRAVMQNPQDKTECILLDGNRLVEDILCKEDLDALLQGNEDRAKIVHTLTKGPDSWEGLRGRIDGTLVAKYCTKDDDTLVLICGPEALEKSMHVTLLDQGWKDEQLLFF